MSAGESLATGPRGRDVIARLDAKQLTILGEWGAQILEGDEPVAFGVQPSNDVSASRPRGQRLSRTHAG
ncbi:MAG: hypothetical protein AAFZ18_39760, partial [Myxococcota bacterium]